MTEDQFNTLKTQLTDISTQLKEQDKRIAAQQTQLENINEQFVGTFYADLTTRADDLEEIIRNLEFTVKEEQVISNASFAKVRTELTAVRTLIEVNEVA